MLHAASRSVIMPTAVYPAHLGLPHQRFAHAGTDYTAIPCRRDVCAQLNMLGMWPKGPINLDYTFPGKHRPMAHQVITADYFTWHKRAFCFNEIGTGKTIATLWAADYLLRCGEITSALVVTTLSTIRRAWGDEIKDSFSEMDCQILHGSKHKRLLRLQSTKAHMWVINHDGVLVIVDELYAAVRSGAIGLIIVDEGAEYSNAQTDKYKALKWLCNANPNTRVWWLTGSPMPHAPTDIWSQARVICPDRVPQYYSHWRDMTMYRKTEYKWAAKADWVTTVTRATAPVIRFKRADCFDLPPTTYTTRVVEMSKEQHVAYEEMRKKLITEIAGKKISAVNEGVMLSKLVQITCGAVYTSESDIATIGCAAKLAELDRVIQEAGGVAVVFVSFRSAIDLVLAHLRSKRRRADKIDGGVSSVNRDGIISGFQSGLIDNIVAHPRTMAHGLTLVRSSIVVWFGPPQSYRIYEQANGRITRPGQTQQTTIIHIVCSEAEQRIYARLQENQELQGLLLTLLETKA